MNVLSPIYVDLSSYKRLDHFRYFKSLAYPYVGTTCEMDITTFYQGVKAQKLPFFLSFLWCVSQAANEIPELRQRIIGEEIMEYPYCPTSHTVSKEDGTYSYCTLDGRKEFSAFIPYAEAQQEQARLHGTIDESETDTKALLFISTLPWMSYTALVQPVPMPADSNPRITWGKFEVKDGQCRMPVSVLCNHALVDGKHLGDFYRVLSEKMENLFS